MEKEPSNSKTVETTNYFRNEDNSFTFNFEKNHGQSKPFYKMTQLNKTANEKQKNTSTSSSFILKENSSLGKSPIFHTPTVIEETENIKVNDEMFNISNAFPIFNLNSSSNQCPQISKDDINTRESLSNNKESSSLQKNKKAIEEEIDSSASTIVLNHSFSTTKAFGHKRITEEIDGSASFIMLDDSLSSPKSAVIGKGNPIVQRNTDKMNNEPSSHKDVIEKLVLDKSSMSNSVSIIDLDHSSSSTIKSAILNKRNSRVNNEPSGHNNIIEEINSSTSTLVLNNSSTFINKENPRVNEKNKRERTLNDKTEIKLEKEKNWTINEIQDKEIICEDGKDLKSSCSTNIINNRNISPDKNHEEMFNFVPIPEKKEPERETVQNTAKGKLTKTLGCKRKRILQRTSTGIKESTTKSAENKIFNTEKSQNLDKSKNIFETSASIFASSPEPFFSSSELTPKPDTQPLHIFESSPEPFFSSSELTPKPKPDTRSPDDIPKKSKAKKAKKTFKTPLKTAQIKPRKTVKIKSQKCKGALSKFVPPKMLSKREIEEDFHKQSMKFLENPNEPDNIEKYKTFIMNRPNVQQLRAQKYVAVVKKTDDGVVVIPAANPQVKRRKIVPLKRKLSFTEFDKTVFSDKKCNQIPEFLEKKENIFNFDKNNDKMFDFEHKLYEQTDEKTEKLFKLDITQSQTQTFTPEGYYKENKNVIEDIMKKYL